MGVRRYGNPIIAMDISPVKSTGGGRKTEQKAQVSANRAGVRHDWQIQRYVYLSQRWTESRMVSPRSVEPV